MVKCNKLKNIVKITHLYIMTLGTVQHKPRLNKKKRFISLAGLRKINEILHKEPNLTATQVQKKLKLVASRRTVARYVQLLGWRNKRSRLISRM